MFLLSIALLWEKDGSVAGVLLRTPDDISLGAWMEELAHEKSSWMKKFRLPVLLRLGNNAWTELCAMAISPLGLNTLRNTFQGITLLSPGPAAIGQERSGAMQNLKAAGVRFALGNFSLRPEVISLLPHASGCELNAKELGRDLCANLSLRLSHANQWCFISGPRTAADAADLARLGVGPFYGDALFERLFVNTNVRLEISTLRALRLVSMVYSQADLSEIEQEIKEDPALSYKLISLINSAGLRTQRAVGTVREALLVLGYGQLSLWLSLLLLSSSSKKTPNQALRFSLLMRAKLASLLAEHKSPQLVEPTFVCGLFSGLDALLDAPLSEILGKANLPNVQRDAILSGKGPMGTYLRLAKSLQLESTESGALLTSVQMSAADVNPLIHQAATYSIGMQPISV